MMNNTTDQENDSSSSKRWIRGVNLGGWLLIERYIVPYQYAITDCHLAGELCWYPGQLSAPNVDHPSYKLCNLAKCKPVLKENIFGFDDYPVDEWNLAAAFKNDTATAERWLNFHFENFIQRDDLVRIKQAGITHVRVPLPHWILGDIRYNEPWIAGDRWKYFVRLCQWCRELGIEVWPNIHTAPGSQNGFDNSGVENIVYTCGGWSDSPTQVERTLDVIHEVTHAIVEYGLNDIVTGFGLLNEPFGDCDINVYKRFLQDGLTIARANMGDDVQIFVSDMFGAFRFNDGNWWLDSTEYKNTLLDTHFYNVFSEKVRSMSPQEHISLVCNPGDMEPQREIASCCYEDAPNNTIPNHGGVQRISTEWSAAYDAMPGELLKVVMKGIAENGTAPDFDRQISPERQQFLKNFVQAQIVAYEAAGTFTMSQGWFYWTIKVEGGAFAEWDFSRGLREGWIPPIADPSVASQDIYGTCNEIRNQTNDTMSIVHEFPWGDRSYWVQDDDDDTGNLPNGTGWDNRNHHFGGTQLLVLVACFALALVIRFIRKRRQRKGQYTMIV